VKLHTKIILLVTCLGVGIGLCCSLLGGSILREAINAEFKKEAEIIVQSVGNRITQNVIDNEVIPARHILQEIINPTHGVDYAYVIGFDGEIFAHSFEKGFPRDLAKITHEMFCSGEPATYLTSTGPVLDLACPLVKGMPAHVHIGINKNQLNDMVTRLRDRLLVLSLFVTLFCVSIGIFVIRRFIYPLRILTDSLHSFAEGTAEEEIRLSTGGQEVRELITAFNVMKSKREGAEKALRESMRQVETILQSLQSGVIIIDTGTHEIIEANPAACKLIGATREQIVGHVCHRFMCPDEEGACPVTDKGQTVDQSDRVLINADAMEVHIIKTVVPITLGDRFCLLESFVDITERKKAEDALRKSEERLALAIDATQIGMFDWNMLTKESFWTQQHEVIFGCPATSNSAMHTYREWANRVHPDDLPRIEQRIQRSMAERKLFVAEYRIVMPNGSLRWIEARGLFIYDVSGKATRMIGTVQDITERKHAEERLQRAEKMEALGTLAGGVAHDLNNVLGIVVGYSELLLDNLDESSSAGSEARKILKGGQRAAAIVQDLLTLARRGVKSRKVLNFNCIVLESRNLPEFSKALAYHPNIGIKMDLEPDLLNISGSGIHLEKSFINLLSNAAEAMPNGGTLTVKTANHYLDKPISGYDEVREGDYVVLSVSDTGEGIPASDLKHIFEPFYTKKIMGRSGTGLGLAVVWGTVKDHDGYITVRSEEGKGTTFALYFPVTREDLSPEEVGVSASEYMGNGESILVVDDVKEQRELAGAMLKKLVYSVVSASSGEEAVEYLKQHTVDLVVLDMIMDPGMDGLDAYAKILQIHPDQKAIIVSGFAETGRVKEAQSMGAGTYVKKPYVLEKLGLAVRKELDRTRNASSKS